VLRFEFLNPVQMAAPLSGRQKVLKRAVFALRRLAPAIALSGFDQKSVEFVINGFIRRQMPVQELLGGGIAVLRRDQRMPCQDPAGISVGHKEGLLSSVEQDGIHSLRSKASQFEELVPEQLRRLGKKRFKRAPMDAFEPRYKRLNGAGLLPEIPGGADAGFELCPGTCAQLSPSKESGLTKASDRHGDIPPAGILSQDGAEDDFQASACRPPTLGAELQQQRLIVLPKHFTRLNSKRLSRALHRLEINTVFTGKSSSGGEYR